MHFSSQVLTFS